ncbi:MAG: hypothetical protein ACOYZ8_02285 [Chloroflexota bacterium]
MKSTFKTIGRILLILAVAVIIIAGLSALTSSTADVSAIQPPAFDPSMAGDMPAPPDHHEEGASALGLLELAKNIGVIGLIVTIYWFGQKWTGQMRRRRGFAS